MRASSLEHEAGGPATATGKPWSAATARAAPARAARPAGRLSRGGASRLLGGQLLGRLVGLAGEEADDVRVRRGGHREACGRIQVRGVGQLRRGHGGGEGVSTHEAAWERRRALTRSRALAVRRYRAVRGGAARGGAARDGAARGRRGRASSDDGWRKTWASAMPEVKMQEALWPQPGTMPKRCTWWAGNQQTWRAGRSARTGGGGGGSRKAGGGGRTSLP